MMCYMFSWLAARGHPAGLPLKEQCGGGRLNRQGQQSREVHGSGGGQGGGRLQSWLRVGFAKQSRNERGRQTGEGDGVSSKQRGPGEVVKRVGWEQTWASAGSATVRTQFAGSVHPCSRMCGEPWLPAWDTRTQISTAAAQGKENRGQRVDPSSSCCGKRPSASRKQAQPASACKA